jgi:hypothetical protein
VNHIGLEPQGKVQAVISKHSYIYGILLILKRGQADNFYDTQLALELVQGLGFKAIINSMLFLYLVHLVLVCWTE